MTELKPPQCDSCGSKVNRCRVCGDKIVWLQKVEPGPAYGSCYDCGTYHSYDGTTLKIHNPEDGFH